MESRWGRLPFVSDRGLPNTSKFHDDNTIYENPLLMEDSLNQYRREHDIERIEEIEQPVRIPSSLAIT